MLSQKIKALLATARIANVPSVVSNVFTGMMMTVFLTRKHPQWDQPTIFAMLAGVCLYIAGNFLNDWHDVAWDEKNRPERAIPSGLFSRGLYLGVSIVLATCGLLLVISISKYAAIIYCLIATLVILYTILHKKHSYSIWIMGCCRAGLYLLGCAVLFPFIQAEGVTILHSPQTVVIYFVKLFVPPIGMMCYIAGISLLARFESSNQGLTDGTKIFASMLLLLPCMTHSCFHVFAGFSTSTYYIIFGIIPFLAWTTAAIFQKITVQSKVSRLLAGISLVDATLVSCTILVIPWEYISKMDATFLLIPIFCFLSALLLQKIAPAT
jgi:4-hydroxybenzoate polyprenyltransferase